MRAHVLISGRVQGVGFRNYLRSKARKLNVYGWVTNAQNGWVEAEFEGQKDKIDQMIKYSKHGPFLAKVSSVKIEWKKEDGKYTSFEVIK